MTKASQLRAFDIGLGMLTIGRHPAMLSNSGIGSGVALTMRTNETGQVNWLTLFYQSPTGLRIVRRYQQVKGIAEFKDKVTIWG